jgi:hypothetical protein
LTRKAPPHAFKPGQSGNPGGKPKSNLNKLLSQFMAGKDTGDRVSREKRLAEKLGRLALSGDMDAIRYVWDRLEGKIPQPVDLESGGQAVKSFTLQLGDGAQA